MLWLKCCGPLGVGYDGPWLNGSGPEIQPGTGGGYDGPWLNGSGPDPQPGTGEGYVGPENGPEEHPGTGGGLWWLWWWCMMKNLSFKRKTKLKI